MAAAAGFIDDTQRKTKSAVIANQFIPFLRVISIRRSVAGLAGTESCLYFSVITNMREQFDFAVSRDADERNLIMGKVFRPNHDVSVPVLIGIQTGFLTPFFVQGKSRPAR